MEAQATAPSVPLIMAAPFGLLLIAIAAGPLWFAAWWDRHYPKVAGSLALLVVLYYILGLHAASRLWETGYEYISFIALIGSLFVVSGGIHINVKGEATPLANAVFLLIGAVAANLLGTTGASMLLIRPWLRMNRHRAAGHHVIFFIFIVSNVGGCLTAIGDPPLFLGYLSGVPFWWVTARCLPVWCVGVGVLLAMFLAVDYKNHARANAPILPPEASPSRGQWRFQGLSNIFFLAIILGAALINHPPLLREALMLAAALGSYYTTPKAVHESNHFNLHPINEVAILFLGIFATMTPALDWLQFNAGKWADATPAAFYFSSGLLSSLLDNAPTYLCFLKVIHVHLDTRLLAISIGSVFFGACTYIGNGPNFMVKSIADHQKVQTPGFLGYILKYTLPFMAPMILVVWLLFFGKR